MNIENNVIRAFDKTCSLNARQNAEADFVLPDYFADISKILKCTVAPFTEAVSVSGDKVSVSGKVLFSLLYTGEDNMLYNFENEIKYTKVFQGQNTDITDNVIVSQFVSSHNYRALGPKRIEIKCDVRIFADIVSVKDFSIISSVESENLYTKTESKRIFMPVGSVQRDFSVNETVSGITSSQIRCIMRKTCKVKFSEVKPISNKLFVKGECETNICYLTVDGRISYSTFSVPFSEVTDLYMLEENDLCTIKNADALVNVSVKEDGENNSSFDVNINVYFTVNAVREKEITYIGDLYSSTQKITTEISEFNLTVNEEVLGKTFGIDFEADTFDADGEIADCFADSVRVTGEISDDKQCFIISGNCNALIKRNDGSYYLVSRSFLSENNLELNKRADMCEVKLNDFEVLSVSALRSGSEKIRFKGDIHCKYTLSEKCKEKLLTSFNVDENANVENKNRIVLYYGKKDEEIWDIAKENRASVTKLKQINCIQGDCLGEDKMLILTNF